MKVEAIYISPVKSLALMPLERGRLEKPGLAGDRVFCVLDEQGGLVTQREHFPLVQVRVTFDVASDHLALTFPNGDVAAGTPEPGEEVTADFWGERPVAARVVDGPFSEALSAFADRPLRLVRYAPGQGFDGYPVSMCSLESLRAFAAAAGIERDDGRRFRQNLYISGVTAAHAEDAWVGGTVRVGGAVLRGKMKDPRCVVTTRNPDTGDHQLNTLKIIATYRKEDEAREVNFGVYCTVIEPGEVALGDQVTPL